MRAQQTLFIIWFSEEDKKKTIKQMDRKWRKQENFSTTNNKIQDVSIMAFIYLSICTSICLSIHLSDTVRRCILCMISIVGREGVRRTHPMFVCLLVCTYIHPKTRANFQHPMLSSHVYMKTVESVSKFSQTVKSEQWTYLLMERLCKTNKQTKRERESER